MNVNDWITDMEIRGITSFNMGQAKDISKNITEQSLKTELGRLSAKGRIQSVYNGFYVIVPVQYKLKRVVPPSYYINELMQYIDKPYYVGLLSAANIYGATHQKAMLTQVVTIAPRVKASSKNPLLDWNYRQEIPEEYLVSKNGETGIIKYSNPELTAVDIVQFAGNIGGYQRAATVLAELIDELNISKLSGLLKHTTNATIQRLGYMLEYVLNEQEKANELYQSLKTVSKKWHSILMSTKHPKSECAESNHWRVNMNIDIEIDEL